MKKEKLSKKPSGLRITAFAVIAVMFLALLGTGVYFLLKPKNEGSGSETIVIDDVSTDVIDEINNQIVYASSSDMQTHYNAAGDYMIEYSSKKFSVYDSNATTTVIPKSTSYVVGSTFSAHYYPNDEASTIEEVFTSILEKYSFVTNISKTDEGEDAGLSFKKYSYSDKDLITETEETVNLTVYVKSFDDTGFAVLEVVEDNSTEKTATYLSSFITILESFDLHPENLNQNSVYIQEAASLQFTYDVKKWKMESSSSSLVNFIYIPSSMDESESFDYNYPTLVMSTSLNSGMESEEDINNSLSRYITGKSEFKEGLTVLEEGKKTLGNIEFSYVSYKYTNENDTIAVIGTHYEGYYSANDAYVSITTEVPDLDCDAVDAFNTLFSSIKASSVATGTDENVLGTSTVEFDRAAIIGKPAVVHIFNKSCAAVKFGKVTGFTKTSNKTYSICSASTGSGSFINDDGYILTNAHVAKNNPVDVYLSGVSMALDYLNAGYSIEGIDKDGFIDNLLVDIASQLVAEYPEIDFEDEGTLQYIFDYLQDMLVSLPLTEDGKTVATITYGDSFNYIQKGKPFEFDYKAFDLKNKYDTYSAEIIKYNEIDSQEEIGYKLESGIEAGQTIADLALLKITDSSADSFYSISLEDPDLVSSGQSALVIGFPGIVENTTIFSEQATTIPTITKGAISAIKPSFDDSYDLLQIDASVSGGNSGGPIFNSEGSLVGVVTYGISGTGEGGDYNAGISVSEVVKFLDSTDVGNQSSPAVGLVKSGLDDLSVNYYSRAVEKFTEASGTNEDLSALLSPLIKIANQKIDAGEDETPVWEFAGFALQKSDMIIVVIVCGVLGLGIIVLIVLFVLRSKRNKRNKTISGDGGSVVVVSGRKELPTPTIDAKEKVEEFPADIMSEIPASTSVAEDIESVVEEPTQVSSMVSSVNPYAPSSAQVQESVTNSVTSELPVAKSVMPSLTERSRIVAEKRDSFIDAMLEKDLADLDVPGEDESKSILKDSTLEKPYVSDLHADVSSVVEATPSVSNLKVGTQTASVVKSVSNGSESLPPDLM